MKKKIALLLTILLAIAFVSTALALPPGKEKVFETKMGNVTFSGKVHSVNKCADCHPGMYAMKAGAGMNPAPHKAGEYCGQCHNGEKAFDITKECGNCHKK